MGKPSTKGGFNRNVFVNNPIYNEGQKKREITEAAQLAEIIEKPNILYEQIAHHLRPLILSIVERAFRRWANAHKGASVELVETEWKRFKKILNGML